MRCIDVCRGVHAAEAGLVFVDMMMRYSHCED